VSFPGFILVLLGIMEIEECQGPADSLGDEARLGLGDEFPILVEDFGAITAIADILETVKGSAGLHGAGVGVSWFL
jgi:hypothetical protein